MNPALVSPTTVDQSIIGNTGVYSPGGSSSVDFGLSLNANSGFRNAWEYRSQTPLPADVERVIDRTITTVGLERTQLTQLYYQRNLITRLDDWIGIGSVERQRIGRTGRAERSMLPEDGRGERFRLDYGSDRTPIFCTWEPFDIDFRTQRMGERGGIDMESQSVANANRVVNLSIEDQGINGLRSRDGVRMTINGLAADGLLATTSLTTHANWSGLTGEQITDKVLSMIETLGTGLKNGPYALLYPRSYIGVVQKLFIAQQTQTVIEHLRGLGPYEGENLIPVLVDSLPAGDVAVVELSKNSTDLLVGEEPIAISWIKPPMTRMYCVVACAIFRFFADANGKYGVVLSHQV